MNDLQTYQGYFKNGQFISSEKITIPEYRRVILTVLDEPIKQEGSEHSKIWNDFFEELANCNEPIGLEFDEIMSKRTNFSREIDL